MKYSELQDKTLTELSARSRELRMELFNLKLQKATSQLEKPVRLRELRRDIARVETRITAVRQKGILEQVSGALQGLGEFNADTIGQAVRALMKKESIGRKNMLRILGNVFNRKHQRLSAHGLFQQIENAGRNKALEVLNQRAAKV